MKLATLAGTQQPIFFVAQEKGFLAEEGIEVEVENITSGGSMVIEVMAAGQVDLGVSAPGELMLAIEKGVPVKLVEPFEYQFIAKIVNPPPNRTVFRKVVRSIFIPPWHCSFLQINQLVAIEQFRKASSHFLYCRDSYFNEAPHFYR